jgi:hypothetical protein
MKNCLAISIFLMWDSVNNHFTLEDKYFLNLLYVLSTKYMKWAYIGLVVCVRPSLRMSQLENRWTDLNEVWCQ